MTHTSLTLDPRRFGRLLLTLVMVLAPLPGAFAQTTQYLDHQALTSELRALTGGSPLATLESIGKSGEGRDLWMVQLSAQGEREPGDRPGLLVVANLEGDHLIGSALALESIRHILGARDASATLENRVVYVLPRLNPDGAEAYFSKPLWSRRTNATQRDDDNDARTDEDPTEDLNGDGMITQMRVADAEGTYRPAKDEPRLMVAADRAKGESGTHKIYWEGEDTDGDGFFNEDGPGGVDLNRNFQHDYPYWQTDAGAYMVSEPESRALMDFMIAHRNIGAILTFGHSDNLVTEVDGEGNPKDFTVIDLDRFANASFDDIKSTGDFRSDERRAGGFGRFFGVQSSTPPLRGPQKGEDNDPKSGRRPETSVHEDDRPYFAKVAESYREITGVKETVYRRAPKGAFFQYGYFQFGVPSFSTPGWGLEDQTAETEEAAAAEDTPKDEAPTSTVEEPNAAEQDPGSGRPRGGATGAGGAEKEKDKDKAGADAKLLEKLEAAKVDAFVSWTPFQHPQLGSVEIGGFKPYALTNPPAQRIPDLGSKHGLFVLELASLLADVHFVSATATEHGGGVFTIEAEIENRGFFPTALRHGIASESVHPVNVQLQIDPKDLLTGDAKTSTLETLAGSGARKSFLWVIRGKSGDRIEIQLLSQKGGRDVTTVTLR